MLVENGKEFVVEFEWGFFVVDEYFMDIYYYDGMYMGDVDVLGFNECKKLFYNGVICVFV